MDIYDSDDQFTAVAQSCRNFNSGGLINNRFGTAAENISCGICRRWDGTKCIVDAFDNVLTRLD